MRRVTAMVSAAAFLLFTASSVFAQGKADFSGKWTRDMPAAGAAAGGGGGGRGGGRGGFGGGGGFNCGAECTIVQAGNTLTVKRAANQQGVVPPDLVFNLDGSDSKNMQPGRGGAEPTAVISKAKWDGAKLVISTTRDMQGTAMTSTQTISIEGGKLTIVTTSTMEGAQPQTATYTKG